jgi:hypothetical protein
MQRKTKVLMVYGLSRCILLHPLDATPCNPVERIATRPQDTTCSAKKYGHEKCCFANLPRASTVLSSGVNE